MRFFFPTCYIQYVRFSGNTLDSDTTEEKIIEGDIYTVIKSAEGILQNLILDHPGEIKGFQHRRKSNYPIIALRELIINAILHRDYEVNSCIKLYIFPNRIFIENPGGYVGGRPQSFPLKTEYRNPILASVLKNYGFVEMFGVGLSRAIDACESGNNKIDINYTDSDSFSVTIFSNQSIRTQTMEKLTIPSIAFFNNKGGVGKTTLLYHVA